MQKRKLIRVQLFILLVVVVLIIWRAASGPASQDGFIVMHDLEPGRLVHQTFKLDVAARVQVEGAASLEVSPEVGPSALATYGWLLRREDHAVVWRMTPENTTPERGTLVSAEAEVALTPGTYDVYYTTFGNTTDSRRGGGAFGVRVGDHWENDQTKWRFRVQPLDAVVNETIHRLDPRKLTPEPAADVLWTTAPMYSSYHPKTALLAIDAPVALAVYGVGEICEREPCDYGWIEDMEVGEVIWQMTEANTEPAGGMRQNRLFDGQVRLEPGLYRFGYRTDRRHAYRNWVANPPYDPHGWGLTVRTLVPQQAEHIRPYDPWANEPLIQMTRMGDYADAVARFELDAPLSVVISALGELRTRDAYDYAWLENETTGERIWTMEYEQTQPAGGEDRSREALAFLDLAPGRYALRYTSDDSHSYEGWHSDPPRHPERWGVALFTQSGRAAEAFRIVETQGARTDPEGTPAPLAPDAPFPPLPPVLDKTTLGNTENVEVPFALTEVTTLRIEAVGEISIGNRYDFGWIARRGTEEVVWEMTRQNTEPAGGDDDFRRFRGLLTLQPGDYILHFKTDWSNAYGNFPNTVPDDPEAWGVRIEVIDE